MKTKLKGLPAQWRAKAAIDQQARTFTGDSRADAFLKCSAELEATLHAQAAQWRSESTTDACYGVRRKCADEIDPEPET